MYDPISLVLKSIWEFDQEYGPSRLGEKVAESSNSFWNKSGHNGNKISFLEACTQLLCAGKVGNDRKFVTNLLSDNNLEITSFVFFQQNIDVNHFTKIWLQYWEDDYKSKK